MTANASDVAAFLESHDFNPDGFTVGHHRDAPDAVTFRLNGLTGVHLPWLADRIEEMGWHVEKIENPGGGATITVEEGTDPFIPSGPDLSVADFQEYLSQPLDLGFPDGPNDSFTMAAEEADGDYTG